MEQENLLRPGDDGKPSALIGRALLEFLNAVARVMSRARQRAIQGFIVFSVVLLLLWIAAFLYGSFYYSYMPKAAFSAPVHYYYRTDCESPASFFCSYPVANISLMRNRKHVLTLGQAYQVSLQLEMPDSPINQELGMFMIKTTCFSRAGGQVASSARTARQLLSASSSRFSMLRYRSDLLKYLGTLLFLPAFLTGVAEQKQLLEVELFSDYTDDPYVPSTTAVIEIMSSNVQIYSSQLVIYAHFTGLRYLLFNFPLLSALVGISSNFFFLSLLFVLSYVRLLLREDWGTQQDCGNVSRQVQNRGNAVRLVQRPSLATKLDGGWRYHGSARYRSFTSVSRNYSDPQLRTDGLLSGRDKNMNNQEDDEKDAAAGTAELMGPLQMTPTNLSWERPHLHSADRKK